jgi:hypothetical protein
VQKGNVVKEALENVNVGKCYVMLGNYQAAIPFFLKTCRVDAKGVRTKTKAASREVEVALYLKPHNTGQIKKNQKSRLSTSRG